MPDSIEQTFDQAVEYHRAGRLTEAGTLYLQVLDHEGNHPEALHLLGVTKLQIGQLAEALELIKRAADLKPQVARYQISLGQAFSGMGRLDEAIAAHERAAQLQPDLPEAWFGWGTALQAIGRYQEAVDVYGRVIRLNPDHVDALNNLGNALHVLGRTPEAIKMYRRALEVRPESPATYNNLAIALQRGKKLDEAVAAFRKSIELRPDFAGAWNNLGCALIDMRQFDEAVLVLRRAIELQPQFAEAWYNLGNALKKRTDFSEALAAYRRAVEIKPDYADALINQGNALQALRQYPQAAESYRRALTLRPNDADVHNNLGIVLRTMGQIDQSVAAFKSGLFFRSDYNILYCNLGNALKDAGRLDEAIAAYRRAVELKPSDWISHSNLVYSIYYSSEYDGAAILQENLRFAALHATKLGQDAQPHRNVPDAERRLRIGYVGSDFRDHCQSFFTLPLFANHDHERFEIYCYSNVARPDAITERNKALVDRWQSIVTLTDAEFAQRIRDDEVDIVVDLTMHMSNGRLLALARRPAPVQVTYLAYPGTTGLSAIDYRLTDPFLDPPGDSDLNYAEKSIRLPETFWCYDPLTDGPSVQTLPALHKGYVTFGCLNNFCKVTDRALDLWGQVLRALPQSRMILLCPEGAQREKLLESFRRREVHPGRIELVVYQPREKYLETYHRIDLGLDTIPYNGHTTSLDSFWMGVPVVTRVGRTAVGRGGWSQLSNLGLEELAAWRDEDFMKMAVDLAGDLDRLARLRTELREKMRNSPLMNGARFARDVETAYRNMWDIWCKRSRGV
jgi:protein O-GlcNAc transferase